MTSGSPAFLRRAAAVIVVAGFALAQIQPARGEEEKKGFFSKMFGGGKTEEKPAEKPAEPKEEPKAESKPKSTTSSKSKSTASKPKSEPAKTTTTPKKAEPKPVVVEKKTEAPKTTPKVETKSSPAPEPKPAAAITANVKNEVKPSATNPWHIIDVGGRDYVTLESIRNFYNPLFGFTGFRQQGNHIWLMSSKLVIKAQIGSQELLMNNMKFILSFPVISHGERTLISRLDLVKLVDPVMNPTHLQDAKSFDTIVIDAGHGGHDSGARGVYGCEKDYTLLLALELRSALMTQGFKVVLTRSTDVFLSLSGRVSIANQIPNSIFVSLHFNSGDSRASGIETWALTPQFASATISRGGGYNADGRAGNHFDSANIALASAVHASVYSKLRLIDRGIKRAQWNVLAGINKPGILFEGGFVTNQNENHQIHSESFRKVMAYALADGIQNYRRALSYSFSDAAKKR